MAKTKKLSSRWDTKHGLYWEASGVSILPICHGNKWAGKFIQVVARALYCEHEQIAYNPKDKDERRIAQLLADGGYFVKEKFSTSNKYFFRPASWLRRFSL